LFSSNEPVRDRSTDAQTAYKYNTLRDQRTKEYRVRVTVGLNLVLTQALQPEQDRAAQSYDRADLMIARNMMYCTLLNKLIYLIDSMSLICQPMHTGLGL